MAEPTRKKKRILWHSNFALAPTGFGSYTKYILSYLYKTGKYEIANYAAGLPSNSPDVNKTPWKTYPSIPVERGDVIQRANADPNFARLMSYGEVNLDATITDWKPDIYVGSEDWWGQEYALGKKFWNKINCVIHWTADSLPLLDGAVANAPKVKHHYVWSSFAEKEYNRLADILEKQLATASPEAKPQIQERIDSYRRVKTIRGCVNDQVFFRHPSPIRADLRARFGIPQDTFVIASGSRNQLRKLWPQQIEGFGIFQRQNPGVKAKMIYWSDSNEGWSFLKSCEEYGVNPNDILLMYKCRASGELFLMPPRLGDFDNPRTGTKGSVRCVGIGNPAKEEDINNFLNLADLFILTITSGGSELWLSQAKLTEIPTLANSYSCFEEQVGFDKGCLEVDQNFTYELGTQFKKAAVYPSSIAKQFKRVYEMDEKKRRELGNNGRDFVLKHYSIEVVAKQWEALFDSLPDTDWDFDFSDKPRNPQAEIPENTDNKEWVRSLYKLILAREPDEGGWNYWQQQLTNNAPREGVVNFFRQTAEQENKSILQPKNPLDELPGTKEDRVLINIPKSYGDCVNFLSLLPDARELYKDKILVLACEEPYKELFEPFLGVYIDHLLTWTPQFDDTFFLEGRGSHPGYFSVAIQAHFRTQRILDSRSGADKIGFDLSLN